jgi:hypothetical protein
MAYLDTRLNIKIRPETKTIFEQAKTELNLQTYNEVVLFLYNFYNINTTKKEGSK